MMDTTKVALVTGASSGIGWCTAIELRKEGFMVYGAARRMEKLQELEQWGIHAVELDVTDDASMKNCVETILAAEGRIDILVNSAGYGSFGAVEDVPMKEGQHQIEVNLLGLARMTQLVLPIMREHHFGRIINISSIAGRTWVPFGAWYHASKYAVEGFSDALRLEVEPFGIDVILVEPGIIKTEWGSIAADHLRHASEKGAYWINAGLMADALDTAYAGKHGTTPEAVAKCIAKAAQAVKPKTRYLLGRGAMPLFAARLLMGDRTYDKLARWVVQNFNKVSKWI